MIAIDQIGPHKIDMRPYLNKDGTLDLKRANQAYKELALKIIQEEPGADDVLRKEYFNFFMNICNLRATDVSAYLMLKNGQISQWRGHNNKKISPQSWNIIRIFFSDLFKHDRITNPALIANEKRRA